MSHKTLLRMTAWVDEIFTSHKTFLRMTKQEKFKSPFIPLFDIGSFFSKLFFNPQLISKHDMTVYPFNVLNHEA